MNEYSISATRTRITSGKTLCLTDSNGTADQQRCEVPARWRAVGSCAQRSDDRLRRRHPAEDAALRLDHREAGGVKLGKIGGAAVGEHDAAVAAIVGLAHRGVDAHF